MRWMTQERVVRAKWTAPLDGEILLWWVMLLNGSEMKNSTLLITLVIIKLLHKCRARERERAQDVSKL